MDFENISFEEIKKEEKIFVVMALIRIADFSGLGFGLSPKNLNYDRNARVSFVLQEKSSDFLSEYKAICGYALQDKYKYEDYIQGGLSLLNKNDELTKIAKAESVERITEILKEKYEYLYESKKSLICEVKRKRYIEMKVALVCLSVLLAGAVTIITYGLFKRVRIDDAYIEGHEAYLARNYPGCIECLSSVPLNELDKPTKMIIAVSMVKTDNLTQEQKDNLTLDITTSDTEILFEYWVEMSRNMYEEAENTAKQLSDDELLLYAYMKESVYLKNNINVAGEEKATRLELLQTEIEKLSKVYETEEETVEKKSNSILR